MSTLSNTINTINTMEELSTYVTEYIRLSEEIERHRAEISDHRKSVLEMVKPLKRRTEDLQTLIMDYLEHNNLPGIRKDGYSVYVSKKQIPLPRETKIKNVIEASKNKNPEELTKDILTAIKKRAPSSDIQNKLLIQHPK